MPVKFIVRVLLVSVLIMSTSANAKEATLTIVPNKCVALSKGKTCYQTITFTYSSSNDENICLFRSDNPKPLACWENESNIVFRYEYSSKTSDWFSVINSDNELLASEKMNVVWVYRKPRKRNQWRLFLAQACAVGKGTRSAAAISSSAKCSINRALMS